VEKLSGKKTQIVEQKPRGKFRALLYDFSQAHLYVSFFYIGDRKHYTRTRRLACMYVAVITCLAANGFSFSDGNGGWNLIKWAIASLVCNVLQAPFVGMFRWLFSSTAPRHPVQEQHVMLNEVSKEFEMFDEEGINLQELEVEEGQRQTAPPSRVSYFLDICDEIAGMIAKHFETKEVTWEALFSLLIISLFYFSICVVTLYLLPISFTYITTLHQCILGVIAFVFFFGHLEWLYIRVRLKKYRQGVLQEWRVGSTNIILSCIMLGSILLLITFVAAMIYYLPFLIPFHTPLHSYVNAAVFALCIVFVLRLIGLILSIRMPGLKREDPLEEERKKKQVTYKFPWWFIYINYVLCFSFIGLMTFFCLVYGVHFNVRDQTWDWMMASWMGLTFYMFVRLPLTHLFMYVLYGTFVKTMEASLFPEEIDFNSFRNTETQTYRRESDSSDSNIEGSNQGSELELPERAFEELESTAGEETPIPAQ
jgi:hypothetical protein